MEVCVELRIAKHESTVLGALVHHLLHRSVHVVLGEFLGGSGGGRGGGGPRGRRSRSRVVLSKILGEEELLRLLDVLGWGLEEELHRGFSAEAIDLAVWRGPIDRAIGLYHLTRSQTHGAGIVELALGRRCRRRRSHRWRTRRGLVGGHR